MGTPVTPARAMPPRKRRDWLKLETCGLALLAVAVCLALGARARQRASATHNEVMRLQSVVSSIQQFEARFQPITPLERRRWSSQPDSGLLGIAPDDRLSLTESIARLAENSGLETPRVSFGSADTTAAPHSRPGSNATLGDYTITIDAAGGFAQLLTFVNALPVSVSVAHLDCSREASTTRFHVTLAVYENTHANQS
jgi:hypothetical protein